MQRRPKDHLLDVRQFSDMPIRISDQLLKKFVEKVQWCPLAKICDPGVTASQFMLRSSHARLLVMRSVASSTPKSIHNKFETLGNSNLACIRLAFSVIGATMQCHLINDHFRFIDRPTT